MNKSNSPLANRIRPETFDDMVGQTHLVGEHGALRRLAMEERLPSMIFFGPHGTGKTTAARILAKNSGIEMRHLNATTASLADVRAVAADADGILGHNGIILYLDEIQYFNKKQQQILLSYIENGDITLIASTTENPYFYVYNAILSRSTVFEFKTLSVGDIASVLSRAMSILTADGAKITLNEENLRKISQAAAGDVRRGLNMLELCFMLTEGAGAEEISDSTVEQILSGNSVRYDREGDEHYDVISAYQKSMRGSDPNAAVYYLARLLAAGDLPSACRRLLVCANEDVGLAYPQIIPIVKAAVDTALQVGLPEARIPLANAVIAVATAPKSNSAYEAINAAMADVESGVTGDIPRALQNKHFDGEGAEERGQNYLYPHSYPMHYVNQQYLPDNIKNKKYYEFGDNKLEQISREYWEKIKHNKDM